MKRFALLCTGFALLTWVDLSAQSFDNVNAGRFSSLGTDKTAISQQLLLKESAVDLMQKKTAKTSIDPSVGMDYNNFLNRGKNQTYFDREQNIASQTEDYEYVRQRMRELERALYNKTKKEIIEKKGSQYKDQVLEQTLEEEYKEKKLDLEVKEKIETELALKNFGKDFFTNGIQGDTTLFSDSAPSDYQLGPGDKLKIIVWSEMGDETVYDVQVNPEGQVYVPIIGIIGVSGKTVGEFESIVLGKLAGKFKHFKGQVTLNQVRTIMVFVAGEVERPGALTVSGLTTAFSGLYQAGGPTDRGSMRSIRVIEPNGKTKEIDLYRYFLSGDRKQDVAVKNGDTIFVPTTEKRVAVSGMVTRPAIYELLGETSLAEVMKMAGNILPEGYAGRISITRWTGNERRKSFDVSCSDKKSMTAFKVMPGDVVKVERSTGIVENSVSITGPVNKPGNYSADGELRVSGLIKLAGGMISETANYEHGQIVRKIKGGKDEIISFDLRKAMAGDKKQDLVLKALDEVRLFEEKDIINEVLDIYIGGAVRNTGIYHYREGMKLADLVLLAKGLNTDASGEAEIARTNEDGTSVIIKADIKKALEDKDSGENKALFALDKVNIIARGDVLFEPEVVILKGQVMRPGAYALKHRGEKLSSLIKRAGGLTDRAFIEGTIFMRDLNHIATSEQLETTLGVQNELFRTVNLDLRADLIRAGAKESDINKITADMRGDGVTKQIMDKAGMVSELGEETIDEFKDKKNTEKPIKTRIAIPMKEILDGKAEEDIELMDGDEISIPIISHTVSVLGAVMNPTTVMYNAKGNAAYYINRAGGYSAHCDHRRTVVIKANGEVFRLRRVAKISRGDVILVPPRARIVKKDTLKEISSIAQILGNLAVTYKVVNDTK